MKSLLQKKVLILLAAVLFLTAVCIPVAFAQTTKAGIQFVQKLSNVLENGSVEEGIAVFDSIPAELKDDVDMMLLKASLLLSCERVTEAEEIALKLIEKEPKNIDVLDLNVMVAKKKGDKVKKSQLIKQILLIEPRNALANIELADEQALKKNWRNARDYYKKALSSEPENPEALFGFGKMCYYMEKDDDAKNAFNKLIEIEPDNPQVNAYLGKYAAESSQYKKAIEYVNKAISLNPENPDFYFDKGTYSRYLGDYAGAEASWKKAIELEPNYFLGYAYLAGLYDEQNKTELALENYRMVVQKNPEYYYGYESLGMLAWHAGNWAESQKAFEKARAHNQSNISYTMMICACMMKQKKQLELKTFTEQVMKKMTDRAGVEYKIVRMYHDRGGDADVAVNIQKETNRNKKGKYLFYLALYYELTGKDSLAHKYYSEVTKMQSPMIFEYRLAQWAEGIVQ